MKVKALVIRTVGDKRLCEEIAGKFESTELRRLRLENEVLRRENRTLRQMELEALGREIDAMLYGRRVVWRMSKAVWQTVGSAAKTIQNLGRMVTHEIDS